MDDTRHKDSPKKGAGRPKVQTGAATRVIQIFSLWLLYNLDDPFNLPALPGHPSLLVR